MDSENRQTIVVLISVSTGLDFVHIGEAGLNNPAAWFHAVEAAAVAYSHTYLEADYSMFLQRYGLVELEPRAPSLYR